MVFTRGGPAGTAPLGRIAIGNNFWAFGDKWAGISASGKRFVVDTKSQAKSKAGNKSTSKTSPKKRSSGKKGGKTMTSNKGGRKGSRIVGNIGIKGLSISASLLALAKWLVRSKAPQVGAYTTAVANIGAGLVGGQIFGTGKSLVQFGAVDGVSELIYDLVTPGGALDLPGIGGAPQGGGVRWNF